MMRLDHGERLAAWLEDAWVERYLAHQLNEEEEAWFEAYAMDKGELLDRLDEDTNLRDGLAGVRADSLVDEVASGGVENAGDAGAVAVNATEARVRIDETDASNVTPLRARTPSRLRSTTPILSLAASVLIGVGIGWLAQRTSPGGGMPGIVASPTRIVYDTVRDEPSPPRVEHAESKSPYVLIEVAVPPGAEHVTLKIGDSPPEVLAPSAEGFASLLLERQRLSEDKVLHFEYTLQNKIAERTLKLARVAF